MKSIGIVGGTGKQGGCVARQLLRTKFITPDKLYLSNRSGSRDGFNEWPEVHIVSDNQVLLEACDVIVLSVKPPIFPQLNLVLNNKLVISIMAGVTIAQIKTHTKARAVVRTMPNIAAEVGEAYTPWLATSDVKDHHFVQSFLETFGEADEVCDEDQLNFCMAVTGCGPGFIAYYAQSMIEAAVQHGIDANVAEKAVKQLFYGTGKLFKQFNQTASQVVQEFIDATGATANGLLFMKKSDLAHHIQEGIQTAYATACGDMTQSNQQGN